MTVKDAPDAVDLSLRTEDVLNGKVGQVCFDRVSFKYAATAHGNSGGLKNISFVVEPGKMVALVGASGAGKR